MDEQQNGNVTALQPLQIDPQPVTLTLPGIEVLLPALSPLEQNIFETDLRTVINTWLRAKGLIKV